jgi:cell division septation protein DedD
MSMMLTFRAGKLAALMVSVAVLVACSREQQDWRSAEASDTVDGYGEFLQRHPDSELATEARTRVAQLSEDREWQSAGSADTADAYKQFLAQHPNGKWAQEARIRMENFALGREGSAAAPGMSADVGVSAGVSAGVAAGVAAGASAMAGSASGAAVGSAAGSASGTAMRSPAGSASTAGAASGDVTGPGGSIAGPGAGAAGAAAMDAGAEPAVASAWRGSGSNAAQVAPGEPARPLTPGSMPSGTAAQATPHLPAQAAAAASAQASPQASSLASPTLANAWRSDPGFGVQLGAFASENAATSEWQQLTSRFSAQLRGLAPRVVSAETSTGRLFRLQALVADEAAARTLCDMLRKQSQACVPVLPH